MPSFARTAAVLRTLHWRRGLRAGFAVAAAMLVCRIMGKPMGWAALGGFEAVLVDNGGPYRSRMNTMAAVLFGGALCGILGSLVPASSTPASLFVAILVTAAVCFAVTFARVASQPIASTSVIILVIYFAGFGSSDRSLAAASSNVLAYVLGGLWAAAISLYLWPVDPFRPARLEVAGCYELLADFTASLHISPHPAMHDSHDDDHTHAVDFKRQLRAKLESARAALSATPARAPSRTIRARNLSVLLETADLLFAATVQLAELAEVLPRVACGPAEVSNPRPDLTSLPDIARWLSSAERTIAAALKSRPADNAASFAPEGSHRVEFVTRPAAQLTAQSSTPNQPAPDLLAHLHDARRDALQNVAIAFEAVYSVWTGTEASLAQASTPVPIPDPSLAEAPSGSDSPLWLDAMRENWTLDSIMMRHALRMAVVGAADVLLIRTLHISHGFWLAMTSIIVLQPAGSGTLRKGLQRVGGTIGGGLLAALFAATIHSYTGIIAVITACSILTLATYAIDYGWYSFFLTPTFVLMSLPYLRDWRYAGVRILTTLLGALTAVVAMRLLWPNNFSVELTRLLGRCASAASAYVRAVLLFWNTSTQTRRASERNLLAPARRACGLSSQDAEEALDRVLLDTTAGPVAFGRPAPETESALTFTTYIRRFTQCLTTLAAVGAPTPAAVARLTHIASRLDHLAVVLTGNSLPTHPHSEPAEASHLELDIPLAGLAEQMLQRMERQTGTLERAAAAVAPAIGSTTA